MCIPRKFALNSAIIILFIGGGIVSAQTTSTGSGQAYPDKPLRLVTAAAGSGGDFVARTVVGGLKDRLGQPVVIDNRASAVTAEIVARSPADGYTVLFHGSTLWIGPLLSSTSYDPVRDFTPVSMLGRAPLLVVVHPSLPVATVKELIAYARSKPGTLNYASGGAGGSSHLAAELFKSMAAVDITRISYKSTAGGLNDLLGNHVHIMFNTGTAGPHVKSGRLRALAITSAQSSPLYPGVPTVAEAGVPGYQAISVDGVFVPVRTPSGIVRRLNTDISAVVATTEVKERLLGNGTEAVSSSPEELAAMIKTEMARMGKLIKDVGIKAE